MLLLVANDISDRKRAEREAEVANARFHKSFFNNPAICCMVKLWDGAFLDVNDALLRTLGYRREDVVGKSVAELGLWVDPDGAKYVVDRVRNNDILRGHECQFRHRDGSAVDVLFSAELTDFDGEDVLLCVAVDISERKKAEREVLIANERFYIAFSASPSMLAIVGADDGIIRDVNSRWSEVLGYQRDDVVGRSILGYRQLGPSELSRQNCRAARA